MTDGLLPIIDRYNPLGEWKPLVYPGDIQSILQTVISLSTDDEVRDCLLYSLVTGKRVIEFVVRTSLELPAEHLVLKAKLHLWQCPRDAFAQESVHNTHIYDGWYELDSEEPQAIRAAIDVIGHTMNRIAFAFGSSIDWRLKYRIDNRMTGYATPDEKDMELLRALLSQLPSDADNSAIDVAIDWCNRGRTSRNVFVAFICYYIALESVAIAIADGEADFRLGYSRGTKQDIANERRDCIDQLYRELYTENPVQFSTRAYFDCVVGLKKKVRKVVELLFGTNHPYITWLFDSSKEQSLADIRSGLAHGRIAFANRGDEHVVRSRLSNMAEISYQFIVQLAQRSVSGTSHGGAQWSGLHAMDMSAFDPRTFLTVTTESILPPHDWKIRPEWCDS